MSNVQRYPAVIFEREMLLRSMSCVDPEMTRSTMTLRVVDVCYPIH